MLLAKILGKKRTVVSVDVISFNMKHVSTGQVGAYIQKLYREEKFLHIGYRHEGGRFVIYTLPGNNEVIQYFEDRCPAMVENECRALTTEDYEWVTWPNGFEEVKAV